ncbi:MAG: hypothetical protein HYS25_04445 [Ignavibacteriales bacterium]|nr:hypothetical protein [Ignavibacteriales bacterium]
MFTAKKRISKKEIKQDTLVTSYYKVYNYFMGHQAKILIGAGVVALAVVAVILFANKRSSDNLAASNLLAKVIPLYEAAQYKDAIDGQSKNNLVGLKNIVDNYGSTEQGETAKIFLANAYLFTGKQQEAFETYEDYSGSNPLFKATALAGMGGYYETKKEFEKAADLYKEASQITKTNPSNSEYLLKASVNLLKSGAKEEAAKLLKGIKEDYKNTSAAQEVDRYLIQTES